MAGRFGKKPFLKKPAYVRPKVYAPTDTLQGISIDETILTPADDSVYIEEYFQEKRFSTRLLVWVNFAFLLVFFLLFIIYVFSPSKQVQHQQHDQQQQKQQQQQQQEDEEPHRVSFNLVPANGSDGKWAVVSLKSYGFNTNSILYLNVCCTRGDGTFFCNPTWASFKGHDAKIKITRQHFVGSSCQLIWSD